MKYQNGDLVFIQNTDKDKLKENDIIAFRDNSNYVTIHKIEKIEDSRNITDKDLEGVFRYKIPKLGSILYFILKPQIMITIFIIILIGGTIWIHIAGKLDKKEINKSQKSV